MYLIENGNKKHVSFTGLDVVKPPHQIIEKFEFQSSDGGSSKKWLYIALVLFVIAALVLGYLLYKHYKKPEKFGYQLV
jgi:hypothetical protein